MPLNPKAPLSENIKELHGGATYAHTARKFGPERANAQAVAIALDTQRRAKRAFGGMIPPVGGMAMNGGMPPVAGTPGGVMPSGLPMAPQMPGMPPGGVAGGPGQAPMSMPPNGMPQNMATTSNGVAPPVNNPMMRPLMNTGGGVLGRAEGGFAMQKSPHLAPPWQMKNEIRGMHTGPILSASPGRADTHVMRVPSNSYILPAAHIASMGQGNSVAGLAAAHSIFGPGGPYGSGAVKIAHGPGAPRPQIPKPMKFADGGGYSEGGAKGDEDHPPVDVALSGGEYIIGPIVVRNIGKGSYKNGHKILDSYVMASRRKEIKTQQNLPPPAKK